MLGGSRSERETGEARMRKILTEKTLREEYEAAQAEFDLARANPGDESHVQACGKRYIDATVRLRKFLANGEIPSDVAEKLDSDAGGLR